MRVNEEHEVSLARCPSPGARFEPDRNLRLIVRWVASAARCDWPIACCEAKSMHGQFEQRTPLHNCLAHQRAGGHRSFDQTLYRVTLGVD